MKDGMIDSVVKGGKVVTKDAILPAAIGIDGEKIVAVGEASAMPPAKQVIDATGKYVLPGLIDPHTHPGAKRNFVEDIRCETQMAALGGVTTHIGTIKCTRMTRKFSMPAKPEDVVSYFKVFPEAKEIVESEATVDIGFTFAVLDDQTASEIPAYAEKLGVTSFKFYMGYKRPTSLFAPGFNAYIGLPIDWDDGTNFLGFENIGKIDGLALIHAENTEIARILQDRLQKAGKKDLVAWYMKSPGFVEASHVVTYAHLAQVTNATLYVVHTCSKDGLEEIRRAKARGIKVVSETCPHYMIIDPEAPYPGVLAKINTPVQGTEDRQALWEGTKDGMVECIGTDHIGGFRKPEYVEGDVWKTHGGISSTQVTLPLMITEGHFKRGIPLPRIVEVCSYNNARYFGLYPRKGTIQVGSDADLVIVDLEKPQKVDAQKYLISSDFNIYHGRELKGWPTMTILRGKVIMKDGEVIGQRGGGRYLYRTSIVH